jgi:hypothetical protein
MYSKYPLYDIINVTTRQRMVVWYTVRSMFANANLVTYLVTRLEVCTVTNDLADQKAPHHLSNIFAEDTQIFQLM